MIQKLIRQLAKENLDEQVVENPYCHPICCDNLEKYLSALWKIQPKILLVGEAPGYRGCALTGVPFTAEYNMMQMENEVLGAEKGYVVLDEKKGHYQKEGSATTIWSALEGVTFMPLLWNIFPFHPYKAGNKRTNRTPTAKEMAQGVRYVRDLLAIFDSIEQIYALGRKAEGQLKAFFTDREIMYIRHPANGGATMCKRGIEAIEK